MNHESQMPTKCTFNEEDWRLLGRFWHPIARSQDVNAQPWKATLLDEELVAYRVGSELVVARDVCPHRGVPLSFGSADPGGAGIVCPYHGLRFGEGGRCNRIPSTDSAIIPGKLHLKTFPAVERYGLVWTCLLPQEGDVHELPLMPHWGDPEFQQIVCPPFEVAAFAGRQLEGFLDVAHFAWIHADTFADSQNQHVPDYVTEETPYGFCADYRSSMSNYPVELHSAAPDGFEWHRHFEAHLPFTATLTVHFPDNGRLVIMNAASPVSARRTRLFAPICKNFDKHIPVEDIHAFNHRVFEEDRAMVECQKPERLPLNAALEGHIPADRSSIAYRRGLKRLGFGEFFLA